MDLSLFIAKLIAVVYVAVGLGMLLNMKYYQKMMKDVMKSSAVAFYGGMFALAIGFLLVTYHNFWVADWTVIITILGWAALVKGALLVLIPGPFMKFAKVFVKYMWFAPVFALILGLVLGYFGFFVY
ncbi:hypothetical protein HOG17_01235 [Candidatus Peregrinibacteria bacterium]|nr:hypothetical protein [Candidatus Peregrinibacteria bacterium]MBT4147948.1 hypothetical protein [Candidatus Peregrinibacteria bacterium]MBT4366526.1 hypothetical protein [Candidatus Peregrinibacteria bacterium]MBT4456168.1 hypothetical protein [Candidatus Peregrinibacteria bacterium]